ncbi:hypothetical protein ACTOB_003779 [Actinoplanes oblitus]|uniref:DUF5753 domain-containing protein n=1 Tax=Actinoplanes oblitus TaxID=3040509 RepID=A0ABY8WSY2_9ACTN|nr:hypothetical protein [Actinoplanes oblitus]WIN00097.1 hypothetical protein ACTOB_003779 [Actinoplanes oblitus]
MSPFSNILAGVNLPELIFPLYRDDVQAMLHGRRLGTAEQEAMVTAL